MLDSFWPIEDSPLPEGVNMEEDKMAALIRFEISSGPQYQPQKTIIEGTHEELTALTKIDKDSTLGALATAVAGLHAYLLENASPKQ
jgi:hypothetical protein